MPVIDKGNIEFIVNNENHDASVYNRPVDTLADEVQLGFDEIDTDIASLSTDIESLLDEINGEVI